MVRDRPAGNQQAILFGFGDPLCQPGAPGRRQGYGRGTADRRRWPGHLLAVRTSIEVMAAVFRLFVYAAGSLLPAWRAGVWRRR